MEYLLGPCHPPLGNHHALDLNIPTAAFPFPLLHRLEVDVLQLSDCAVIADIVREGKLRQLALLIQDKYQQVISEG